MNGSLSRPKGSGVGLNHTARSLGRVQKRDLKTESIQAISGNQASNASADHRYFSMSLI
jgi:hypothetical protein